MFFMVHAVVVSHIEHHIALQSLDMLSLQSLSEFVEAVTIEHGVKLHLECDIAHEGVAHHLA